MKRLTAREVHAHKIRELGLDPDSLDLMTAEGLSAVIRRAASYLCPCSEATILRAVVEPLRGLVEDMEEAKKLAESTLEAMIAYGDLQEQADVRSETSSTRVLLYATPPSFVMRQSGVALLIGVAADQLSPLTTDLSQRIQYLGHVRRLDPMPGTDLRAELRHFGLIELSADAWLRAPRVTHSSLVAMSDRELDSVAPSRDIPGLLLLDPTRQVRYYKGRWVEPKSHTGRYIARRQRAYGADLWCYARMANGLPQQMIDLPRRGSRWRGCDEAWHLQMAIDRQRGSPQSFRITSQGKGDTVLLEFFSPVPAWARRRWDAIGEPISMMGCLFAYRIPRQELDEERRFAHDALWLEETNRDLR